MTLISELKIAILVDNGVDHEEVVIPREYLEKSGIRVEIVSPQQDEVRTAAYGSTDGARIKVDKPLPTDAHAYSSVLVPGGDNYTPPLGDKDPIASFLKSACRAGALMAVTSRAKAFLFESEVRHDLFDSIPSSLILWKTSNLEGLAQQILDRLSAGLHSHARLNEDKLSRFARAEGHPKT
jgi:hypothetical protein